MSDPSQGDGASGEPPVPGEVAPATPPAEVPPPAAPDAAPPAAPTAAAADPGAAAPDATSGSGSEGGSRSRLITAIVLVVAMLAALFVLVGSRGSDDGPSGEVVLEAAAAPGPDPFTDDVSAASGSDAVTAALRPPFERPALTESALGVSDTEAVPMKGTTPGLYGGTREVSECDPAQLIQFLTDNADKASAWAGVHDIDPSEIETFVDGLTSVVLRSDTQVTNHGFRNGSPTAKQSVLEAGTAVLVDDTGVPRVKCNCGNPLLPAQTTGDQRFEGDAWPEFEPSRVAAPQPAAPVEVIVLVGVDDGAPFARPVGTDGEADTDAPPDVNVSDPVSSAITDFAGDGTSAPADDAAMRFAAGGEALLSSSPLAITDSRVDLGFTEGGGPASGPFSVTMALAGDGCSATLQLDGTFDGSFDGTAALSGTWSGNAALTPTSGDCAGDEATNGPLSGDWSAVFDQGANLVAGTMTLNGSPLFDFDLQTG